MMLIYVKCLIFVESLRAIAETIQVAYEVSGWGELELNVKMLQRKGSLLIPENLKATDVQFSSLKNVGEYREIWSFYGNDVFYLRVKLLLHCSMLRA